jgi:hypothetical protein
VTSNTVRTVADSDRRRNHFDNGLGRDILKAVASIETEVRQCQRS